MSDKKEAQIDIRTLFSTDMQVVSIIIQSDQALTEDDLKLALKFYTEEAAYEVENSEDLN